MKNCFFLLLAAVLGCTCLTACDDDDVTIFKKVYADCNGEITGEVSFKGRIVPSDTSLVHAFVKVETNGQAEVKIAPMTFNITLPAGSPMQGTMVIATAEDFVVNSGISITQSGDDTQLKAKFSNMLLTSMNNSEAASTIMAGDMEVQLQGSGQLEIKLVMQQWGNMPFPLTLHYKYPELDPKQ